MVSLDALGDRALTIRLGDTISAALVARSHALAAKLRALPFVEEVVVGYCTVTVFHGGIADIAARLEPYVGAEAAPSVVSGAAHVVPVRYDGPDLADVAERTGLSVDDVIARHTAPSYVVYLVGFVPGFAYLGDLDPALAIPRRPTPRPRVPAGSVAIAGRQTAVYPLDTPGGWHLIGRTSVVMFDPQRDPPSRLAAGDTVRFEAVGSTT
jgi:5-oxoprolinase (ATP-hydrolysing) subunit B